MKINTPFREISLGSKFLFYSVTAILTYLLLSSMDLAPLKEIPSFAGYCWIYFTLATVTLLLFAFSFACIVVVIGIWNLLHRIIIYCWPAFAKSKSEATK